MRKPSRPPQRTIMSWAITTCRGLLKLVMECRYRIGSVHEFESVVVRAFLRGAAKHRQPPPELFQFCLGRNHGPSSLFSPRPILATSEPHVNMLENGASAWQYPDARFSSPSVGSTHVPDDSHAFLAPADGQFGSQSGMMHGAATSSARNNIGDSPAQIQAASDRRVEEARHICVWCGKSFVRASTLKEHQQRHDNLRQFTCAEGECNSVAFNTKGDLRSHTRRVHNNARKAK
ncbi:hypothetical protein BD626DRAFT_248240 [Schizophyllum amplum]|uniref:C2H2-type domain-containing protein n=1 Tax=Schizophyllum amplum TaxID=97359 RepID=A0A550BV68_9AGAR|nr:hypothetical protein BD626DRAFT_248240 [Auriculariopsis ampla]